MNEWDSTEVIHDWLNHIDNDLIQRAIHEELWHSSKELVLDSIEVLEYIRKATDNIHVTQDNRFQKLVDLCCTPCRNDYFHRFLGCDKRYYPTEALWWIDCWQSIRLNNTLNDLHIRSIRDYFKSSEGRWFKDKWKAFFNHAKAERYGKNSLPAFSYLECIRFLVNLNEPLPLEELTEFLDKLCEKVGGNLRLFPNSNEIRGQALGLIKSIDKESYGKYNFNEIYFKLLRTLKELLLRCSWDKYSYALAPTLLKVSEREISNLIVSKIPNDGKIEPSWVTGNNSKRKARHAFLSLIPKLTQKVKYFELIEPNRFAYAPYGYVNSYEYVGRVIGRVLQGFEEVKDIQKRIQDNDIREDYFRDLIKLGLNTAIENKKYVKWVEKERDTPSGRRTDIFINVTKGPNIPTEVKLLWRFPDNYEPIGEVLDQVTQGNLGITVVINPPHNPCYMKKYQDFDGWINYVKSHKTYIHGTMRYSNDLFESNYDLKTKHFYSDHQYMLGGKRRNVTLLNFFIDLRNYVRSPCLSKL